MAEQKNIIPISGIIGLEPRATAEYVRQELAKADGAPVEYTVSSPGGIIYEGLEIFNLFQDYKGQTISKIIGMAASMASYIPLAADYRIAKSNAILMTHSARLPYLQRGTAEDHRDAAEILDGMTNLLAEIYAAATGKTIEEMLSILAKDKYHYGKAILDAGFVNEIEQASVKNPTETEEKAILDAKAQIYLCIDRVNSENIDLTKAAAILGKVTTKPAKPPVKPQPKKDKMEEKEFLAYLELNPEAKPFFDAAIAAAKAETQPVDYASLDFNAFLELKPEAKEQHEQIVAEARTEVEAGKLSKEKLNFIAKVIGSEHYDNSLKATGVKVFAGEKDFSNFEDLVAQEDRFNEKLKSLQIKNEQPESTPGEDHQLDPKDVATTAANAKALAESANQQNKVQ